MNHIVMNNYYPIFRCISVMEYKQVWAEEMSIHLLVYNYVLTIEM